MTYLKQILVYCLALPIVLTQCSPSSSETQLQQTTELKDQGVNPKTLSQEGFTNRRPSSEASDMTSNLDHDSSLVLDPNLSYVLDVETCLYIRTSPEVSDTNIIQCLIPESNQAFITSMFHELVPTGKIVGDWAEFTYAFDVYTLKPEPQDNILDIDDWLKSMNKAHKEVKQQYRTYREKGWIKFKNSDKDYNIKIKKPGC